jgi:hypothetical protein
MLATIVVWIISFVNQIHGIFNKLMLYFFGMFGVLLGCTSMAWWIVGIVWRFNHIGRYSCGDIAPYGTREDVWHETIRAEGSLFQV